MIVTAAIALMRTSVPVTRRTSTDIEANGV
jgi:hypothetical protein